MRHIHHKTLLRRIAALILCMWICFTPPGAIFASSSPPEAPKADIEKPHGETNEKSTEQGKAKEAGGHGSSDAEPDAEKKVYKLAEPLGNKFDLSTLRNSQKTCKLRHNLEVVSNTVPTLDGGKMNISMALVLEFGSETGMAEAVERNNKILDITRKTISRFTADELATTDGKLRFKEMLALNINRLFTTAHVRQIYYIMFHITL